MTDRRHEHDTDETIADDATDSSTEAWEDYSDRAEDEKRLDKGEHADDSAGMSAFPDVDLLADSLRNVSEVVTGDDTDGEEKDPDGRRGAP